MTEANHQEANSAPPGIFISIRARLLLIFTIIFLAAFALVFYWFYNFATDLAMSDLQKDMMATALSAAAGIDGDKHTALYERGEMDDEAYTEIADFLRVIKSTNPKAAGVYTFIQMPDEPDQVRFVVSAAYPPGTDESEMAVIPGMEEMISCQIPPASRPDMGTPFGWEDGLSPTMLEGVRQMGAEEELWEDEWGNWLSGYAPIYNSAGEPVGAAGIDMCAEDVLALQQSIRQAILPAFGTTFIVLAVTILIVSYQFARPIRALTDMADAVGQGDYNQNFAALYGGVFRDEVETLAKVFEGMVDKVRVREEKLTKKVQELQIMIDESKRQEQVSEIVDTDFFRELQQKATDLRSRGRRRSRNRPADSDNDTAGAE